MYVEMKQRVSEVGFVKHSLADRNMWFEKRKVARAGHEGLLVPGWPCGHPWHAAAAVLQ